MSDQVLDAVGQMYQFERAVKALLAARRSVTRLLHESDWPDAELRDALDAVRVAHASLQAARDITNEQPTDGVELPPVEEPEPPVIVVPPADIDPDPAPGDYLPTPTPREWEHEATVFQAGGKYAYISDASLHEAAGDDPDPHVWPPRALLNEKGELADYKVDLRAVLMTSDRSSNLETWPAELSNRVFVFNDTPRPPNSAGKVDRGPKWGLARAYNMSGTIENAKVFRSGKWSDGEQEGHGIYADLLGGHNTFRNLEFHDCGGQAMQFILRPSTTRVAAPDGTPWAAAGMGYQEWWQRILLWQAGFRTTIENCKAINCGHMPPRAGSMVTCNATGQELLVQGLTCRQTLEPFMYGGKWYRSRGAFLVTGSHGARTPKMSVWGLDIESHTPDRPDVMIGAVDDGHLIAPRVVRVDGGGLGRITVYDDCARVVIANVAEDTLVTLNSAATGKLLSSQVVKAGTDWSYTK